MTKRMMSEAQSTKSGATAVAPSEAGTQAHRPPSSLFRRWLDALIDSRMRKVEAEVREHLKFVPDDVLRRAGLERHMHGSASKSGVGP